MAKAAGGDFVFQFPNDNSLPGYLKMGWEQDTALVRMIRLPIWHRRETGKWGQYHSSHFSSPFFVVDKNEEYFKWRYVNHPYFKYEIEKLDEKNYVVYRHCIIKKLPVLLLIDFAPSLDSFFRADFGTIQNFLNSVGRGRLVATLSTPVFTSICKWRSLGFTPLFLGRGACMVVKQIKNIDIVSTKIEITPGYFDTY